MVAALRLLAVVATLVPALALADEAPIPDEPAEPAEPAEAATEAPAAGRVAAAYTVGGPGTAAVIAPVAETPAEAPALSGLARRRAEDPAAGRAYFSETALTTPRGAVTLDFRAPTAPVVATGVRVGVTDRFELGAHGVLVADEGGAAGVSLKGQLWRNERIAIAAGVITVSADGETVVDVHTELTSCVDAACAVTITGALNFLVMAGEEEVPVFGGLGLAMGRKSQLIAEVHQTRVDDDTLTLGYVGARFGSSKLAVDGGLAFAVADGSSNWEEDEDEGLVFPFVGLSIRP